MNDPEKRCGWVSDLETFKATEPRIVRLSLEEFIRDPGPAQIEVWNRSIPLFQAQASDLITRYEPASRFSAVLEYELPREGGRRPDIVFLENGPILVVEYKSKDNLLAADIDQVAGYARDLGQYHSLCQGHPVIPILVVAGFGSDRRTESGVLIIPASQLAAVLMEEAKRSTGSLFDASQWVNAEYAPQLDLLQTARSIFGKAKLPRIKRAGSGAVDEVVDRLIEISQQAKDHSQRHLILVTGVPGAGKTLVGLKFVYDTRLQVPAALLSGNGPLVAVLRHALGPGTEAKSFVQLIKPFIRAYSGGVQPREHIIVFDEAQRAWDRDKVRAKHQDRKLGDYSEPQLLMRIADSIQDWSVVVALVGEGQEIFTGEESGIGQWNEAVDSDWRIHGPEHLRHYFTNPSFEVDELFNLTRSLRSHVTSSVHIWVGCLVDGKPDPQGAAEIMSSGFQLYITRDLDLAKKYAVQRYGANREKRFGLLISSRAKPLLKKHHIESLPSFHVGQWFDVNPESLWSCCALTSAATEFEIQGLELDLPIVCWGEDYQWDGAKWVVPNLRYEDPVRDPDTLRKNTYRVLLSRGRDGMVVYVPKKESMDPTASFLLQCGARELSIDLT